MRVAVAGGRKYWPNPVERVRFEEIWREICGTVLLHGCCPGWDSPKTDGVPKYLSGVDKWAERWANSRDVQKIFQPSIERFPPLQLTIGWPGCGPERNDRMIKTAQALIAFRGGPGTAGTIRLATDYQITIFEIGRN